MKKAIIFDMDGVIIDSEPTYFEINKNALENFGVQLTKEDYIKFGVGASASSFFENILTKYKKDI